MLRCHARSNDGNFLDKRSNRADSIAGKSSVEDRASEQSIKHRDLIMIIRADQVGLNRNECETRTLILHEW